jgi:transcriptional regulator with XRE-family HTH domain
MIRKTRAGVTKARTRGGRTATPAASKAPAPKPLTSRKSARREAPTPAQPGGGIDVGSLIGETIKRMRRDRRMTLDQLATRSGVSKSYLSKIENRLSVPPIGTLSRIAQAFACDIGHFLRREESSVEDAVSIVRERERQPAVRGGTAFGYDYSSLAHKKRNKQMEPFVFTFPADIDVDTFFEHEGEEFILMLRGRAEFETRRNGVVEKWILDKGDSLYIDSQVPHRGRSLGAEAEAVVVIYQRKPAIAPE